MSTWLLLKKKWGDHRQGDYIEVPEEVAELLLETERAEKVDYGQIICRLDTQAGKLAAAAVEDFLLGSGAFNSLDFPPLEGENTGLPWFVLDALARWSKAGTDREQGIRSRKIETLVKQLCALEALQQMPGSRNEEVSKFLDATKQALLRTCADKGRTKKQIKSATTHEGFVIAAGYALSSKNMLYEWFNGQGNPKFLKTLRLDPEKYYRAWAERAKQDSSY